MHIRLNQEFFELTDPEIRLNEAIIDRLLISHLLKHHLFCLSPAEIIRLRRAIHFGPQSSQVLSSILRRSQDYFASLSASNHHISVIPNGSKKSFVPTSRQVCVTAENLGGWLQHPPQLFLENAISDGHFYSMVILNFVEIMIGSSSTVVLRPFHGGGSTLGALIENQYDAKIQGLCICDRDTTSIVPPFPENSTGWHAHVALRNIGVVNADGSPNLHNPFFYFIPTIGWSIENYIGPNVAALFFEAHLESDEQLQQILSVFPAFPNLRSKELFEWILVNFRSTSQDPDLIFEGLNRRFSVKQVDKTRFAQISAVRLPSTILSFIKDNFHGGRYQRKLRTALDADFRLECYDGEIRRLAAAALTACAADARMSFA